jgi:hypothetical protein
METLNITSNSISKQRRKLNMESYEKKADKNNITKNVIIPILFSVILLTGIMVCIICNIAISGNLTWSLIPVSSIVFAWLIFFPGIVLGKNKIIASLISLSIFIVPYLFLLGNLIKTKEIFSVGAVMAVPSIIFLWIIIAIFNYIGKTRKLLALGIIFLLAIPFMFIINIILYKMIAEPVFDIWDILSIFILSILAFISFICGYARKRR